MGADDPTLCEPTLPDTISAGRDLWLVYHRDLKSSQRVLAMRNFLKEVVQRRAVAGGKIEEVLDFRPARPPFQTDAFRDGH